MNIREHNVKLTRISSSHRNLRTDTVIGTCNRLPELHCHFGMYAEPIDPSKDIRYVQTTPVTELTVEGQLYKFRTKNSVYELEVL